MPRKRKLEKVGGGGAGAAAGGKESEGKVKIVKSDEPSTSTSGQRGNHEDGLEGRRAEDWKVLLAIFPEEVWILILEKIKNPDILEALSNASPAFRNLLLHRRVQFLFPKVWSNVLGLKYYKLARAIDGDSDRVYSEPYDFASPLPWKRPPRVYYCDADFDEDLSRWFTVIIKLRMVCRIWCDAIDKWHQNQPFRYQLYNEVPFETRWFNGFVDRINVLAKDGFTIQYPPHTELFVSHFEATHSLDGVAVRNPFLGRYVSVFIGGENAEGEQAAQELERLRSLFLKYGRHIWYFRIKIEDTFSNKVTCYSAIRTLLQLVPNLKILRMHYDPRRIPGDNQGPVFSADAMNRLEVYINSHPLPRLEHLQFLTTRNYSRCMPPPLFKELIRTCGYISTLELGHHCSAPEDYDISTATTPNLTGLSVKLHSREDFGTLFGGDVGWQLSKLDLQLEAATSVEWGRIFTELKVKWGDSLTTLILALPCVESMKEQNRLLELGGNLRLDLPRLSHLKLTMRNLCSLDFLLPLKDTLEVLELEVKASVQREAQGGLSKRLENGKRIQLLSSPDKPMGSNIWTLFPKLKRFRFQYNLKSRSVAENRKVTELATIWLVSRAEWQKWTEQSDQFRRKKMRMWKIRRTQSDE